MARMNCGEVTLDYELKGQGPPLLMICGFRRPRIVWGEAFLAPFLGDFTLILYDNRGTGHSDKPESGYSIEAMADDAAGLLSGLGIPRAHVLGTSMGGMIAQRLATRHPEKVHSLSLCCTHAGGNSVVPAEEAILNLLSLVPGEDFSPKEVARKQEPAYYTEGFIAENRGFLDGLFDHLNTQPSGEATIKGHLNAVENFDGSQDLGRITPPTLVFSGDSDKLIVPENSNFIADNIAGARLEILPEAGHLFWLEKPTQSGEALARFHGKHPM